MTRKWVAVVAVVLLALSSTASAQAPCSLRTVVGTYAVQTGGLAATGSVIDSALGPAYALHGGAAVLVGQVTIAADGTATGTWWGVYVAMPVSLPFAGQVTINPDCSGEYTDGDGTNKLLVLDEGKEIRAIRWEGFGSSVSTWYRITRAGDVAPRCSLHTLRGTYMERCQGFSVDEGLGVATHNLLFLWTAKDGSLTGRYEGKTFGFPDTLAESAISGTYSVADDCTVDIDYSFEVMPGVTVKARGVLFDEGKRGIGLPLGVYFGDTMVAPMAPLTCELTRTVR